MQTAVEWLESKMPTAFKELTINKELLKQAKQMEKEQIIEAATRWKGTDFAEQYYNETYLNK